MTKKIAQVLILIGVIIFIVGDNCNHYQLIVIAIGLTSLIVGVFMIIQIVKKEEANKNKVDKSDKTLHKERDILLDNFIKIEVDLLKCKIERYDYVRERAFTSSERNSIFYDHRGEWSGDMIREEHLSAVVIHEAEINGEKYLFRSPSIKKDKENLRFLLGWQKTTFLYVDKNDPDNYRFDFNFINDQISF